MTNNTIVNRTVKSENRFFFLSQGEYELHYSKWTAIPCCCTFLKPHLTVNEVHPMNTWEPSLDSSQPIKSVIQTVQVKLK